MPDAKSLHAIVRQLDKSARPLFAAACGVSPEEFERALSDDPSSESNSEAHAEPADHGTWGVDLACALGLDESWAGDWEALLIRVKLEKHNGDKVAELGDWLSRNIKKGRGPGQVTAGEHAVDAALRLLTEQQAENSGLEGAVDGVASGHVRVAGHIYAGDVSAWMADHLPSPAWVEGRATVGRSWQLSRPSGAAKIYEHDGGFVLAVEHGKRHDVHRTETLKQAMRYAEDRLETWDAEDDRETARVLLLAILDDAHEGVTPWGDVPTPAKTPWMKSVEGRIDVAIRKSLRISSWADGAIVVSSGPYVAGKGGVSARSLVKRADDLALYLEALLWGPANSPDWAGGCVSSWAGVPPLEKLLTVAEPREGDDWLSLTKALLAASR